LLAENVTVCLGQDDVSDAYYPYGRINMLEVAFLAAHLLWMTTGREIETLYDMITTHAAQAMNVENHSLQVGNSANLVVLDTSSILEALREHAAPKHVIMNGNIIDPVKMKAVADSGTWSP
ncbi:MAG TPA: amidohydrolase family protein, partial [Anaerolineales bacterium]|nr:amidohydrolase family protein [Anaerolineales bacterium]